MQNTHKIYLYYKTAINDNFDSFEFDEEQLIVDWPKLLKVYQEI